MEINHIKSLLISPLSSIKEAIQRLNDTGRKILFITDDKEKLLGTLSDGDIRRGIVNGVILSSPVESIMKKTFISLSEKSHGLLNEARQLMNKYKIEQIPIINKAGVIVDVKLWIDLLSEEKAKPKVPAMRIDNPVVIMAGGKGTRLDPFTRILPKPLIPLGDKPIIENIMDRFYNNGFSQFIIIINHKKEMIKAYFGDKLLPYQISFIEEEEFFGTAGGMYLLRSKINQTFILTNCDTILEGSYHELFRWHQDQKNFMTIVGSHKEFTVPYGVLDMNNGTLEKIDEKPKLDLFINTGTYIFEPSIFDFIKDRQHLDMDKLIQKVQEMLSCRVGVYPHWGGWFDIGQWEEYNRTLAHFKMENE